MTVSPLSDRSPLRARARERERELVRRVVRVALRSVYVPLVVLFPLAIVAVEAFARPSFAWDFRALYQAGHEYLHFHSPYVSGSLAQLATRDNFVYPLPIAAIFAPVSLVPYTVAAVLFVALSTAAIIFAVWLLGVRDWRCYVAVLLSVPAFSGIGLGTISPLLALLLAVVWRYRDRTWVAVPALSVLVLAKLFLWPVGLWLLLTRRFRSVVAASIAGVTAVVVFSLPLGIGPVMHYPALLRSLSGFEGPMSLSLMSLGTNVTGSSAAGEIVGIVGGLLLLAGMIRAARRGDDSQVFRLSVVMAFALSPIVWNHYLLLLCVPLALTRPRFSPLWLASAWILGDGALLSRSALEILAVATWIIILAQTGSLPLAHVRALVERPRPRLLGHALSLGASLCLWGALIWLVTGLSAAVPGAAALTPPRAVESASGTALVRILRGSDEMCWKILTTGIRTPTRAEIFVDGQRPALIDRTMREGQRDACTGYGSKTGGKNLARAYQKGHIRLLLKVVSPAGDDLLRGRIVFDMNDLLKPSRVPDPNRRLRGSGHANP